MLCRATWSAALVRIGCRDLTNNGLGAGGAAAALTFAVPAARLLATDRGRRRLGNRIRVSWKNVLAAVGEEWIVSLWAT